MLSELQAERQLAAIEAASAPNMNPEGWRKVVSKYRRFLTGSASGKSEGGLASALGGIPMKRVVTKKARPGG